MVSEKMSSVFPLQAYVSFLSTVHACGHVLVLGSIRHCYILNIYGFRDEFLSFSQNKSMGAIDSYGVASFDSRLDWQDLCRGSLRKHCYILTIKAVGIMVSDEKIF